ncbi:MAG: hypothetical protein FWG17_02460 [Desulfovibrionaceae bacterium]|nr:hypothetical protein [Desulfovibrionaceae bacterium]
MILYTGAVLAILLLVLFFRLRCKKDAFAPFGQANSEENIRQILRQAIKERSLFELHPHLGDGRRTPLLRCIPERLRPDGLILESDWPEEQAAALVGQKAGCYFTLSRGQRKVLYYAFVTCIQRLETEDHGCSLVLSLPLRLENRRKRSFLRMPPTKEYLTGAALWAADSMPETDKFPMPRSWPKAALIVISEKDTGRAEFKAEEFILDNLSAGGCKLHIPRRHLPPGWAQPLSLKELMLFLELMDPDTRKKLRFWLHCRISYLTELKERMEAGLQFVSWGKENGGDVEAMERIHWLNLAQDEGVPMLAAWIQRRNIEEEAS